jgi:hypothetical protein
LEPLDVPEGTHAVPDELALQSAQVPFAPHEEDVLPGSQVPPAPQQLPAQPFVIALQATWHSPFEQAARRGQSVDDAHPHCPPIVPPLIDWHTFPVLAFAQLPQVPPVLPQAMSLWPDTQVPVTPPDMEQHPPLQGISALHAVPHWCDCGLQACPSGQSSAVSHPHDDVPFPATHSSGAVHVPHAAMPRLHADD